MPKLIVTHHAPDLDAIASVWLLKRFDSQKFGSAKLAFVNPGEEISDSQLAKLDFKPDEIIHTDTGKGEFDHHQPDRAKQRLSATLLVYAYLIKHYPDKKQDEALKFLTDFVTSIDHFEEISWAEAKEDRFNFMIHKLISGVEKLQYHNDESVLQFGFTCLDGAYEVLKSHFKAKEIFQTRGIKFNLKNLQAIGFETNNDEVIKLAQIQGFDIVVRKDPDEGNIRIKARPDTNIDLKALSKKISQVDVEGQWFYHESGKMLLNGSRKSQHHPSPLSLEEIINFMKEIYG